MKSNTESKDLNLSAVIESIFKGDYQLPEFQREYVWKDANIKSLFESVLSAHPIGTILLLEMNKDNPLLAWVNFSEIIPSDNRIMGYKGEDFNPPDYLVLDGQQRLTSLCHITHGTKDHDWYLDLIPIKDSWEKHNSPSERNLLSEWIEKNLDIGEYIKKWKKTEDPMKNFRGKLKKMPFMILKDRNLFQRSLNEVRDNINSNISEKEFWKKNIKKLKITKSIEEIDLIIKTEKSWSLFLGTALPALIENYFQYKLPTVIVSKDMGITGVCKVFTKINTTGIELGAFDLTVAVMYPKNIRLKQMFDDAIDTNPLLKIVDENSKRYILHTLALLGDKSPKTSSLPEVLTPEDFNKNWDKAVNNIENACKIVDEHCGAALSSGNDSFLVYSPLISILAYVIEKTPIVVPDNLLVTRLRTHKLRSWYFGSGISNRYSEGTDAKQLKDKFEISSWLSTSSFEEGMPTWLEKVYGDFNTYKSSAIGKSIISLYNISNQKDFYEDKLVGPGNEYECDLHHIFPKAAMRKKIMRERNIKDKDAADKILKKEYNIDSVLNLTWLLSSTNRTIIRERMPAEYLAEIISDYGGGEVGKEKLLQILSSHSISKKALDHLLKDNYEGFINERKKAIIREMRTTCHVRNILEGVDNTVDDQELEEEESSEISTNVE